jgi:DNA-binding beta-propeller fold protein YncE
VTTYAGTAGTSGFVDSPIRLFAKFNSPSGIAIDTSGNLFVTDYSNNAIRKITPTGAVSTFAGSSAGTAGFADGAGTSALFYSPRGITIDANNNLYVAEGARVRKITPSAVVSTVVGTADGSPFVPGALPNSLTLESRAESVRVFGSELFIGTGGYLLKVNGLP